MSSSIFNFDHLAAYGRLPLRTRLWHAALVLMFCAIALGGSWLLRNTAGNPRAPSVPYMSLVDERLEVMFIGTSHVGYGIDPRLYRLRSMNITAGALNYECMEIILKKYLDQAPRLRVLLLEADIVPLRVDTMRRLDGDYRSLYRIGLNTFDLPLGWYAKAMQWLRESWFFYPIYFMDRWSPSLLVWGRRPLGGEGEGNIDTLGHTTLDRNISELNDGRVVVEHHRQDHLRVDHSAANMPALLRILKMADQRQLPVVFLRMPHHSSYVRNRPPEWEAQYQAMLAEAQTAIQPGLFQCLDWEQRDEFMDAHFADGDHLNRQGVRMLRDLLDPVLLGKTKD